MKKKNKKIINNKIRDLLLNQKGMALLTTLIFVFILVTFAIALLVMTSNDTKLSALQRDSTKAFYIAESGIEKALWYLNTTSEEGKGFEWRTDNPELYPEGYIQETYPVGSTNYYQVTVKDDSDSDPDTDIIIITSRGVVSDGNKVYGNRKIEVEAEKRVLPFPGVTYDYAIATETNMEIKGNMHIDGNIHSNGDISKVAGEAYTVTGIATAVGENPIGASGVDDVPLPIVDFDFYEDLIDYEFIDENGEVTAEYGGEYYPTFEGKGTIYFDSDEEINISDVYFIDGDVVITAGTILNIYGGAIFATGTITSIGNAQITHTQRTLNIHGECGETYSWDPDDLCYDPLCNNPLALVAEGNITLSGTVDVQGIIQTNSRFTSNGVITVDPGAIYADDGIFHGGGGEDVLNIVYSEDLSGMPIPGTGIPYYIIISWQEA